MMDKNMELKGIEQACDIFIKEADKIVKGNEENEFVWASQGLSTGQSMVRRFSASSGVDYQEPCRIIYRRLENKKLKLSQAYEKLMRETQ